MGFFSTLKDIAVEANEEAHGARLLSQTQWMIAAIEALDGRLQFAIMMGYLQIRERLMQEMLNWSSDGRIDIGRKMQSQAREKFDLDISGSYPKYLAGIWIESYERKSSKAQQAFGVLESFAHYIESQFNNTESAEQAGARLIDTPKAEYSSGSFVSNQTEEAQKQIEYKRYSYSAQEVQTAQAQARQRAQQAEADREQKLKQNLERERQAAQTEVRQQAEARQKAEAEAKQYSAGKFKLRMWVAAAIVLLIVVMANPSKEGAQQALKPAPLPSSVMQKPQQANIAPVTQPYVFYNQKPHSGGTTSHHKRGVNSDIRHCLDLPTNEAIAQCANNAN